LAYLTIKSILSQEAEQAQEAELAQEKKEPLLFSRLVKSIKSHYDQCPDTIVPLISSLMCNTTLHPLSGEKERLEHLQIGFFDFRGPTLPPWQHPCMVPISKVSKKQWIWLDKLSLALALALIHIIAVPSGKRKKSILHILFL
jgi:hypothetical protein